MKILYPGFIPLVVAGPKTPARCGLVAIASPATAQVAEQVEGDEDVIMVSATKRDSTIQDVPFSINTQTQEDIQKSGAGNLEDLSRHVAGLSVQNLGPGQSQVSVRGVSAGQDVRDQPGVKEQVGVYLDESVISLSLFTPELDLFDLNRVETLRGPQGTLFGSGSVGGTIRYITNQPLVGVTEGLVESNVNLVDGDDLGWHAKGMVNLPLGERAAIRAVGYYTQYGGFINAIGPAGGEDINGGERYGGRLALTIDTGEGFSITPRFIYQKITADGFNRQEIWNLYANPDQADPTVFDEREQYLKLREAFEDETLIADLVVEAELGAVTLTSVSSYTNRDILVSRDASALNGSVSVDLGYPTAAINLPSNLRDTTDVNAITQDCGCRPMAAGRSSGLSAGSIRAPIASTASACRHRATRRRPMRRWARELPRRPPMASPTSIRPTIPISPMSWSRSPFSGKRPTLSPMLSM